MAIIKYIGVLDVEFDGGNSFGGVERTEVLDRKPSLKSLEHQFKRHINKPALNNGKWKIEVYAYKWCPIMNDTDELDEIIHLKTY